MQLSGTRGTLIPPTSKPIPFSLRYSSTPPAASNPKALPPESKTPLISPAAIRGLRICDSLDAGPPPLISTPAGHILSQIITVQPVAASKSL